MADYFPLLARALDTMSDRGPAARRLVYERARTALTTQLRSLNPPLGEAEFNREALALDDAIGRAEAAYGSEPAQTLPPPAVGSPAEEATGEPIEDRRGSRAPTIKRGGTRRRGPLALAAVLVVIMVPVAILAWLGRDKPAGTSVQPVAASRPVTPSGPSGDTKFADRVGGATTRGERPPAAPPITSPPASPLPPPGAASNPPLASGSAATSGPDAQAAVQVAQRAMLIEEDPADPQQPKITTGRTIWRIDAVNGGQGDLLETVVRATVDFPDSGLSMAWLMRRNTDAAFPASHTIELSFTVANGSSPPRVVRDVAMPQMKPDETTRGIPLAGLSVPVKDNVSLIGLSDLKSDVDRNTDLMLHRSWIDLPIRYASGRKAILSFEKGVSGERAFSEAFRQWANQP